MLVNGNLYFNNIFNKLIYSKIYNYSYIHTYLIKNFQSSHFGNKTSNDSPFVRQQQAAYISYFKNSSLLKAS